MKRAILVICDGLRADLLGPDSTPHLWRFSRLGTSFRAHRSVFPSTTRTTSASIATGCLPRRHGLEGNCVALDEGDGLVAMSVGPAEFRDRLERATGRTLRVPTLAERLETHGGSVVFSNVSAGAAIFQDPDGHGWLHHREVAYAPGRIPAAPLGVSHDAAGDTRMTERFVAEVLLERRPALAVLWLCEPDHTQHARPLGSPEPRAAMAAADRNAGRVLDALGGADGEDTLLVIASDHGHETTGAVVALEALLIAAGLKESAASRDVVVASNGFSAAIYLAARARGRAPRIIECLEAHEGVARVLAGEALGELGLATDSALALAVVGRSSDEPNEHGVKGIGTAFEDPLSGDTHLGCGQHGGLGRYEQSPFLIIRGEGFTPGASRHAETSPIDIAPTVLRHLGLPAAGMDGRALQAG